MWSVETEFVPSSDSKVTYSNLVYLSSEARIYLFFRGLDDSWKPSWASSRVEKLDWKTGGILIDFPNAVRHRPYVKVASNGVDKIHFAYTEGHPRDFPNSVYHVFYRSGVGLCGSTGEYLGALESGLVEPTEGTLVFQGDPEKVAWVIAVNDYEDEGLFILFSVRLGGSDNEIAGAVSRLSYWIAVWNGFAWESQFLAEAGPQIYEGEDDYSGLLSQHPNNPNIVFISTKVDPTTGAKLRHWEIFRGCKSPSGEWMWDAITSDSEEDNLRPLATSGESAQLLWLRGSMISFSDYGFKVVRRGI